MKKLLFAITLLVSSSGFAANLSTEQVRTKLVNTDLIKAIYSVYKGGDWKCQNTKVQISADQNSFVATKLCLNSDGELESSVSMTIKGQIFGEGKDAITLVESVEFNYAG